MRNFPSTVITDEVDEHDLFLPNYYIHLPNRVSDRVPCLILWPPTTKGRVTLFISKRTTRSILNHNYL